MLSEAYHRYTLNNYANNYGRIFLIEAYHRCALYNYVNNYGRILLIDAYNRCALYNMPRSAKFGWILIIKCKRSVLNTNNAIEAFYSTLRCVIRHYDASFDDALRHYDALSQWRRVVESNRRIEWEYCRRYNAIELTCYFILHVP